MVEESAKKKSSSLRSTTPGKMPDVEEAAEGDEEVVEGEEEDDEDDDKFDIDDISGAEAEAKAKLVESQRISKSEKDWEQHNAEVAVDALSKGNLYPSRVAFSKSGVESGVDSPNRFMGPLPHPPKVSPRHVQWTKGEPFDPTTGGGGEPGPATLQQSLSPHRERLIKDRLELGETAKTPTLHGHFGRGTAVGHHRSRSKSKDNNDVGRRTFAVWGHDESDSNASDNDS